MTSSATWGGLVNLVADIAVEFRESIAIPPRSAIIFVMFTRFLIAAIFLVTAGQFASAGLIVSQSAQDSVVEHLTMESFSPADDAPVVIRSVDSENQASGVICSGHSSGSTFAVVCSLVVLGDQPSVSRVRLDNAVLPRSPTFDGLFKPV